jgi:hypothetical protein
MFSLIQYLSAIIYTLHTGAVTALVVANAFMLDNACSRFSQLYIYIYVCVCVCVYVYVYSIKKRKPV